ncbi:MAG: DinB family protein [Candidatus Kariarchaeaceae archaeon]|jgi:uncharacterized damage-inducible protein DinB
MDLQSLGNYYVWAEEKIMTALEELTDDEFTTRHEGLGKSARELVEHLYVTYDSLSHPPTAETWKILGEKAGAMNRKELMSSWITSTKQFASNIASDERSTVEFPVGKDKSLTLDVANFYLLYTDHQTYHRGQLNSLIKIMGKDGVNTDYYSFVVS